MKELADNTKVMAGHEMAISPLTRGASDTEGTAAVEHDIRRICAEVVGRPVEKIKMHRSFLAQGGDSLLGIKLGVRCQEAGYSLTIQDMLQTSSLTQLCQRAKRNTKLASNGETNSEGNINGSTPALSNGTAQQSPSLSSTAATQHQDDVPHVAHAKKFRYEDLDDIVSGQLQRITPNPARDIEDVFSCSPIQEMFLLAQAIHPEMYTCTIVLEVKSGNPDTPLDCERLVAAWDHLVQRHASLRTVFIDSTSHPGHFDQVILKGGQGIGPPLRFVDYDKAGGGENEYPSIRGPHAQAIVFQNYRLTHRATVYRCSSKCSSVYLRVDMSHAVVDGESFPVLLRDLYQAYTGNNTERNGSTIHENSNGVMSYRDFVSYHQLQVSREASVFYWNNRLAGVEPCYFPTANSHGGSDALYDRQGDHLRTVHFRVDMGAGGLQKFCAKFDVTAANLCQVAWALVLRSYTGSEDVCFSYVTSGRQAPLVGIEAAIGAFVDTLICRVSMSKTTTVSQALAKTKDDFIQSLAHPCMVAMLQQVDRSSSQGKEGDVFSRLRGNTIMSCQKRRTRDMPIQNGSTSALAIEVVDAVSPNDVSIKKERVYPYVGIGRFSV